MLALPTEAAVEEKTNICTDWRRPTCHWKLQIIQESLDSGIKTHNKLHRPRRENLEWKWEWEISNGKAGISNGNGNGKSRMVMGKSRMEMEKSRMGRGQSRMGMGNLEWEGENFEWEGEWEISNGNGKSRNGGCHYVNDIIMEQSSELRPWTWATVTRCPISV